MEDTQSSRASWPAVIVHTCYPSSLKWRQEAWASGQPGVIVAPSLSLNPGTFQVDLTASGAARGESAPLSEHSSFKERFFHLLSWSSPPCKVGICGMDQLAWTQDHSSLFCLTSHQIVRPAIRSCLRAATAAAASSCCSSFSFLLLPFPPPSPSSPPLSPPPSPTFTSSSFPSSPSSPLFIFFSCPFSSYFSPFSFKNNWSRFSFLLEPKQVF